MGSFNMKCGASDISIGSGTEVYIIPLLAEKEYYFQNQDFIKTENNIRLANTSMYLYNDDLYKPALLPIKTTYEDSMSFINIKRDENVDLIEKKFNIKIEDFIKLITTEREPLAPFSPVFEVFNISKLEEKSLIKKEHKYENIFNSLYEYNLKHDDIEINIEHKKSNIKINIMKSGIENRYIISDLNGKILKEFYDFKDITLAYLQEIIFEYGNYIISLPEENNKKIANNIKDISQFSVMIAHAEIYNLQSMKNNGIYKEIKGIKSYFKELDGKIKNTINEDNKNLLEIKNDLKRVKLKNIFFSDYEYMLDFYKNEILENENILILISIFFNFSDLMYRTNHYWIPGTNGVQDGDNEISLILNNKVNEILKKGL